MPFDFPWTQEPRAELITNTLKFYWQRRVIFSAENWTILFGVRHDGQMIGPREVSATEFAVRRTVEPGSYLGLPFQGCGFGSEMRAAVMMFAFDELGAARAESAAFLDNPASTRVLTKLGYQPNGQQLKKRRPGEAVLSQNLLLTPGTLIRPPWTITVEGVAACRSVLGHL